LLATSKQASGSGYSSILPSARRHEVVTEQGFMRSGLHSDIETGFGVEEWCVLPVSTIPDSTMYIHFVLPFVVITKSTLRPIKINAARTCPWSGYCARYRIKIQSSRHCDPAIASYGSPLRRHESRPETHALVRR
jgi:hypothetical protein